MYIPETIARHLPDDACTLDDIGGSGATVLQYPKCVLKIQPDTHLSSGEHTMMRWLHGRLNVPDILAEDCVDGTRYLLMSRMPGRYLCSSDILDDQERLAQHVANALHALWGVNVTDCPCVHTLDRKFAWIEQSLREGRTTTEGAPPGIYDGPNAFRNPAHLFDWVVSHRPATEDLVLTHGDCCLPNIFVDDADRLGFIDLGFAGVADRWVDIDKILWSMWANSTGQFGGKVRTFDRKLLFRALSMEPDEEKLYYYQLLDALF